MKKLFLSYSRDALPFARSLAERLRPAATVVDPAEAEPGKEWTEYLRHQLQTADAMVVLVSADALRSKWIQFEVGAAVGMGMPVIPVALEGALDADLFDYLLRDLSWIDARSLTPEDVASRIHAEVLK